MIKLVISDNEGSTTVVPLVRDEISIGRQEGNTIRLTERNVSRRHARLLRQANGYMVEDLSSYNGVLINGKRSSGLTPVKPGDEIGIADYSLVLQSEAGDSPGPRIRSSLPPPPTPARMVMLAAPAPGAVFSLPMEGAIRMGRSEELAIPINHRSVSREHAQIELRDGGYVITDLGSANGMFINGRKMPQHMLMPGDIVELGQVLFRFIGKGEIYDFDPSEAARHAQRSTASVNNNARLAAILLVSAIVVAVIVLVTGDEQSHPGTDAAANAIPAETLAIPTENDSQGNSDNSYMRSLSACESAIAGNRFTEASAHAVLALAAKPDDKAALACQAEAQRLFDDEQSFARGAAALTNDDAVTAYQEFARLSQASALRQKPEVQQAVTQYVAYQLLEGRGVLDADPQQAQQAAEIVLSIQPLSTPDRAAAEALLEEAKAAAAAPRRNSKLLASRQAKASGASQTGAGAKAGGWVLPSAQPTGGPAGFVSPTTAPTMDPMEAANLCLARGDNRCVIQALAGKARSEPELALLIETYRAMGNTEAAQKYMTVYVSHFPTGRRAQAYRAQLDRAEGE